MKLYLGSDHAGFDLKQRIKRFLEKHTIAYEDCGDFSREEEDDYPDFVIPVAKKVAKDKTARGIIFGGSGQGEAIAANRVNGVRAAVYYGGNLQIVKLSREHNDSNVLSLGARFLGEKEALQAVALWLKTSFKKGKHLRRIKKIDMV